MRDKHVAFWRLFWFPILAFAAMYAAAGLDKICVEVEYVNGAPVCAEHQFTWHRPF